MSNIDLRKFVNVNIVNHELTSVNATRDTVVLLTTEAVPNTITIVTKKDYEEKLEDYTTTLAYAKVFFDNGGVALYVIGSITSSNIKTTIAALDNEYIIVCYTGDEADIQSVAEDRAEDPNVYGINTKILLSHISTVPGTDISVKDFGLKLTTVVGGEMTMAAYLSKINVYGINTVQDYCFTAETLTAEQPTLFNSIPETANYNINISLAGESRNIGGSLTNGDDLVNEYVRIILHQTLTDTVLNVLMTKIKGEIGLSAIRAAMSAELAKYIRNGYISTGDSWKDEDLTVVGSDGETYTVISKDTLLSNGFTITILPYQSLTDEDKRAHKTPGIYVILSDSYGIRTVTIDGEII